MSRRLRRDLNKRISSAGYEKITGDLEVTGEIVGPSITNIVTAVAQLAAGTTTPVQLTITRCKPMLKAILLEWLVQYNLVNFSHYEVQVSNDGATWDLGYPSSAQLPDGSVVTVWYEVPANAKNAVIRQATWRLAQ